MRNKLVLVSNSTEITGIKAGTFHYREQIANDGRFRYGNVIASYFECDYFIDNGIAISEGDEIDYYQVTDASPDFSEVVTPEREILINRFIVKTVEAGKRTIHITAFDYTSKLDVDYSQRLKAIQGNFPMSVDALINDAATVAGVTTNVSELDNLPDFITQSNALTAFYADGITVRDVFRYASELLFYYFKAKPDGRVDAETFSTDTYDGWNQSDTYVIAPGEDETYLDPVSDDPLTNVFYKENGLAVKEYIQKYDHLRVYTSSGKMLVQFGGMTRNNIFNITNNIFIDAGGEDVDWGDYGAYAWSRLSDAIIYRPFTAQLFPFRMPYQAGNYAYLVDENGDVARSIIMSIDLSESGVTVESYGSNEQTKYESSFNTANDDSLTLSAQANDLTGRVESLETYAEYLETNIKYKFYNSVADLGLTAGSATIAGALSALGQYSILRTPTTSSFASNQLPPITSQIGIVEIIKTSTNNFAEIRFYGRQSTYGDWRMYTDSNGNPTGTWLKVQNGTLFRTETYSMSVTVNANAGLTVSASDLISSVPSGYTAVAIAGITTGNAAIVIRSFNATTSGNVVFLRNVTGSSASGTLNVYMLFARDDTIA